ncbi:hypothetical protein JCM9492_12780 [Aquifex pyrophilus]
MRKRTLFNALLSIIVFLLSLVLFLFFTFPKFIFIDKLLERYKIFLISEKVYEGYFNVILNRGRVFYSNKEVFNFDVGKLELKPFYLLINLSCKGRKIELKLYPSGEINFSSDVYGCFKDLEEIRGNVVLNKDIRGKLELKGLKAQGFNIDSVILNFRGVRFEGTILYGGMELKGSGTIKLNRKNILLSRIDGNFRGSGINLKVYGNLKNLRVSVR